jgi:hypothetical protein
MKTRILVALLTAVALSACAAFKNRESDSEKLARYLDYAGDPVDSFSMMGGLDGWQSLGRDRLLVRTGVNQAYLLRVAEPCMDLEFAQRVGLTSTGSQVQSRFDSVRVGDHRCQITEIRPVDYRLARQAARASRKDSTEE